MHPRLQPQSKAKFGGLAWAALILGIIGVCGSPLPILNNLTALAAFVGLVLGVIALFGSKKVVAGIGSVLCIAAIAVTVIIQGMFVRELDKAINNPEFGIEQDAPSEPARLNFGDQHTWNSGQAVSVSAPELHSETNPFLQPKDGKRYVKVDVTITNNGNSDYSLAGTHVNAQHNGHVAQQNHMAGDILPDDRIPPGGNATYTVVFEIGEETGELQVSVQPTMFSQETTYFIGQI
ncbi:DUF4352 domain-containing protein [Saccharopolyspora hirsuta]